MSQLFDPYHKWLGIAPKDQPPNHYRLLALDLFESDPDVIDAAANRQMAYLQQRATGEHAELAQKLLNEVSAARLVLLNSKKKAAYDTELESRIAQPFEDTPASGDDSFGFLQPTEARTQHDLPTNQPRVPVKTIGPTRFSDANKRQLRIVIGTVISGLIPVLFVWFVFLSGGNRNNVKDEPGQMQIGLTTDLRQHMKDVDKNKSANKTKSIESNPTSAVLPPKENSPNVPTAPQAKSIPAGRPNEDNSKTKSSVASWIGDAASKPVAKPNDDNKRSSAATVKVADPQPIVSLQHGKPASQKSEATLAPEDTGGNTRPKPETPAVATNDNRILPIVRDKRPVPSSDAQAEAINLLKDIYSKQYNNAKTVEARRAIGLELLRKAEENCDNDAERFIILKLAKEIFVQAKDGDSAFRTIDIMDAGFTVDAVRMKLEVLMAGAAMTSLPYQHRLFARAAISLVDRAVADNDFEVVKQLCDLATASAQTAEDEVLQREIRLKVKTVEANIKVYEGIKPALALLNANPKDAAANLAVGSYYCFVTGEWNKGLPMLAISNDGALQILAGAELDGASTSDAKMKLGDLWWDYGAEQKKGAKKQQCRSRALYWYRQALPELVGLARDKVERRMAEVGGD